MGEASVPDETLGWRRAEVLSYGIVGDSLQTLGVVVSCVIGEWNESCSGTWSLFFWL